LAKRSNRIHPDRYQALRFQRDEFRGKSRKLLQFAATIAIVDDQIFRLDKTCLPHHLEKAFPSRRKGARRAWFQPANTPRPSFRLLREGGKRRGHYTHPKRNEQPPARLHLIIPPDVEPLPQTLEAIARADLITIGPGSLFTSLIPNVLVRGIVQAIVNSAAIKVYVCNLMTQANESLGLTAADHIRALNAHAGAQLFDFALINRTPVPAEMKAKYALTGSNQIVSDLDAIEAMGVCPVLGDYLDQTGVARHATERVARDLVDLMSQAPSISRKNTLVMSSRGPNHSAR